MVREIWLHVEGGGNSPQKEQLRQGFGAFLGDLQSRARTRGIRIRLTFWGPRSETYAAFTRALHQYPATLHLLLVDSESPVTSSPRHHLATIDAWDLAGISDDQCHLMVELMESWFLADPEALATFYGQGFAANALPRTQNVEQVAKVTVLSSLARATRGTQKREYHKTHHAHLILARLAPGKVRSRAPHCERLFAVIEQQLSATAS